MARDQPASGRGTGARSPGKRQRRPRSRECWAEGCGQSFTPGRWDQRCCDDDGCRQRVQRWKATRRQQLRRATDAGREAHRLAEEKRRESIRAAENAHALTTVALVAVVLATVAPAAEPSAAEPPADDEPSAAEPPADDEPSAAESTADDEPSAAESTADDEPSAAESTADDAPTAVEPPADDAPTAVEPPAAAAFGAAELMVRGHAALAILCDRPACFHVAARLTPHAAGFCSPACRKAMRRVLDREQKWLARGAMRGDQRCARELERRRRVLEERTDESGRHLRELHRQKGREP